MTLAFRVDHYHHAGQPAQPDPLLAQLLAAINSFGDTYMASHAELLAVIAALTAQVNKVREEVLAKIGGLTADLSQALANAGNTTPEIDAALIALQAAVGSVDAIVPDAPAPAPVTEFEIEPGEDAPASQG